MSHFGVEEKSPLGIGQKETTDKHDLMQLTKEADSVTSFADYSKVEGKILHRKKLSLISDEDANTLRRKMRESWSRQIIKTINAVSHTELGNEEALSTLHRLNSSEIDSFRNITTDDEVNAIAIQRALAEKAEEIAKSVRPTSG